MEDILKFKAELRKLGRVTLLKMAFGQREKHCVLRGLCPFYVDYKGYGFCVSEILGEGCQEEKFSNEDTPGMNSCPDHSSQLHIGH
jgi:hypothetical protein